jgi:hypothetical protein
MNNKQIPARVSHGRNAFLEAPVKNDNGPERSILPAGQKPLYLCPHPPAGLDHSIIYLCPHFPAGLDRSILPAGQTPLYLCRHFTAASERNIIYMCRHFTAGSERRILLAGQKPLYVCPYLSAVSDSNIIYMCRQRAGKYRARSAPAEYAAGSGSACSQKP